MTLHLPEDFSSLFVVANILKGKPKTNELHGKILADFFEILKFRYFVDQKKVKRFEFICSFLRKENLKLIFKLY